MYRKDLSVIVPVYNMGASLKLCVESIEKQKVDKNCIEVVLVDDGSSDDSWTLCQQLSADFSFVRAFHQENQGVSAARNAGIDCAEGEYLLFLDADDYLSDDALPNIIRACKSFADETDVVSYPIVYSYSYSDKTRRHDREEWLTEEKVYKLSEVPYISQTTMNVVVRADRAREVRFNRAVKMGEDQLFITTCLQAKATIGCCPGAEYYYVRGKASSSARFNNPLYAFDDFIYLFNFMLKVAQETPEMAEYARQMILYNVDWRIKSEMLFPTFAQGVEREECDKKLADIMRAIPVESYYNSPILNDNYKTFLLDYFGLLPQNAKPSYRKKGSCLMVGDELAWCARTPLIVIKECFEENDGYAIEGYIEDPLFMLSNNFELYVKVKGVRNEIDLLPSSQEYFKAKRVTATVKAFSVKLPHVNDVGNYTAHFSMEIDGEPVKKLRISFRPLRHNGFKFVRTMYMPFSVITPSAGDMIIRHRRKKDFFWLKKEVRKTRPEFVEWRKKAKRIMRKKYPRCWVYADLPSSPIKGNALLQLIHDLQKNDGIRRYYISDCGDEIIKDCPQLAGLIVACGSQKHLELSMHAELILSSYLEPFSFFPVPNDELLRIADMIPQQKFVYLQHGIMHAHMPWYFSYDRIYHDYIVASTCFEVENLQSIYHFPEKAIIKSGAPRLDRISIHPVKQKKIIYAPSWRGYLVGGSSDERIGYDKDFLGSAFFQGVSAFLKAVMDSGVLQEKGYRLELKLHPNFKCYEHLFGLDNEYINFAQDNIDEGEYVIVITDFSSYIYDFLYSGSKAMYFLPDPVEFRAGVNQYYETDVPLNDAFGPYTEDAQQASENLLSLIDQVENGVWDDAYDNRRNTLFLHKDGENIQRLYEELMKIADECAAHRVVGELMWM